VDGVRSTFTNIEIAKRALLTSQYQLQTTGHNIANANTAGYSRQVVNTAAAAPIEAPGFTKSTLLGQYGMGVEVTSVRRVRESFLDDQFRNENKYLGEWEVKKDTLEKLEAIFNEPSETGLRNVIENFWNAWQNVSNEKGSMEARAVLIEQTLAMTDAFNHIASQIKDLESDISQNISIKAIEINTYLNQIASLNEDIKRIEGFGDFANDLRDQRDLLVDKLSKIVNISVTEMPNGYTISMGNQVLVDGSNVLNPVDYDALESAYTSGDLNSGEVYGMFYSLEHYVQEYRAQLDSMVRALAEGEFTITLPKGTVLPDGTELNGVTYSDANGNRELQADLTVTVRGINGLHQLGYTYADPDPATGRVPSGLPFFTIKPGYGELTAESITLNPDIANDPKQVASSSRVIKDGSGKETVVPGNSDIALLIAGARNVQIEFSGVEGFEPSLSRGSLDEYFRSIISKIGVETQEAKRQADNQTVLVIQVDERRQAVSGVSLDEEMTDMIRFQHAYNAAARALTTVDELLDKLINGTGIVGR